MKKLIYILGAAIVIFITCALVILSEAKAESGYFDNEGNYYTINPTYPHPNADCIEYVYLEDCDKQVPDLTLPAKSKDITLYEEPDSEAIYLIIVSSIDESGAVKIEAPGIVDLLKECLEYIPDGSDIEHEANNYLTLATYDAFTITPSLYFSPQPWTEPGPISKAEMEVKRLKRQTELHKKIKEIIKTLEGEK